MARITCVLYPQQATCPHPEELAELAALWLSMPAWSTSITLCAEAWYRDLEAMVPDARKDAGTHHQVA
eukprot:3778631-Amphidinium_carterae.2